MSTSEGVDIYGELPSFSGGKVSGKQSHVRLQVGNLEWGGIHVEWKHGEEIARAGYALIDDFLMDVCWNFKSIHSDEEEKVKLFLPAHMSRHPGSNSRMDRLVVLGPRQDGVLEWTVITAFTTRRGKKIKGDILWERREPAASGPDLTSPTSAPEESSILESDQASSSYRTGDQRKSNPSVDIIRRKAAPVKHGTKFIGQCDNCGHRVNSLIIRTCEKCGKRGTISPA